MNLRLDLAARTIRVGDRIIPAWSSVRNELNRQRPRAGSPDVCYSILRDGILGPPTMPRPFPVGSWRVTGIVPHLGLGVDESPLEPYLYPYFIATNAWQYVDEWSLDAQGYYDTPTGRKIADGAYGLHFSTSRTTTGCARIGAEADLRYLVDLIHPRLSDGEKIVLEVVA